MDKSSSSYISSHFYERLKQISKTKFLPIKDNLELIISNGNINNILYYKNEIYDILYNNLITKIPSSSMVLMMDLLASLSQDLQGKFIFMIK